MLSCPALPPEILSAAQPRHKARSHEQRASALSPQSKGGRHHARDTRRGSGAGLVSGPTTGSRRSQPRWWITPARITPARRPLRTMGGSARVTSTVAAHSPVQQGRGLAVPTTRERAPGRPVVRTQGESRGSGLRQRCSPRPARQRVEPPWGCLITGCVGRRASGLGGVLFFSSVL